MDAFKDFETFGRRGFFLEGEKTNEVWTFFEILDHFPYTASCQVSLIESLEVRQTVECTLKDNKDRTFKITRIVLRGPHRQRTPY